MKKLIIIFWILGSLAPGQSTYYISPGGNDVTGDGSIGTPWLTLNKAWTVVSAGDTVFMRGGTYAYNSSQILSGRNGSAGNLIVVMPYDGETVIVTKGGSYVKPSWPIALISLRSNYVKIYDLTVSGFTQTDGSLYSAVNIYNGSNNIIELVRMTNNGNGFVIIGTSDNNLILNCDAWRNYDPLTAGDAYGNADGFGAVATVGTTNTFRGCRAWWNSDDGYDGYGNAGMLIFDKCWAWHHGYREDGTTTGGDGNGFKMGDLSGYPTTHLRTVQNSLAFYNRMRGITQNNAECEMYFYNNTTYKNYIGFEIYSFDLIHKVINNISYSNDYNYNGSAIASSIVTNNTYHASWQPSGPVATDADFVSVDSTGVSGARQAGGSLPVLTFLHLDASSNLIGVGTDVGLSTDGDGEPWSNPPSIGAYEIPTGPPPPSGTVFARDKTGKFMKDKNGKLMMIIQ